jgi:hypothetical protein
MQSKPLGVGGTVKQGITIREISQVVGSFVWGLGEWERAWVVYNAVKFRMLHTMNLISTIIEPDADGTLHLPLPKAWQHQSIRVRAELEPVGAAVEHGATGSVETLKGFGCLRGKISLSPDFDESLDDFKDYMS